MEEMKEMENASEHKEPIEMEGASKYYIPGEVEDASEHKEPNEMKGTSIYYIPGEVEDASEHREPIEMKGVSIYYIPGEVEGEISDEETQRHDTTAQSEVPRRYKRREINIVLDRLAENGPSGFGKLLSYLRYKSKGALGSVDLRSILEHLTKTRSLKSRTYVYPDFLTRKPRKDKIYSIAAKGISKYIKRNGCDRYDLPYGCNTLLTNKEHARREMVKKVWKATKGHTKCNIYPYGDIEVTAEEQKYGYPDLTVQTNLRGTDGRHVIYIKIEVDDYNDRLNFLAKKMMRMTGTGIVLCPTKKRIESLMNEFLTLQQGEEKVRTDGVLFGVLKDYCVPNGAFWERPSER